MKTRPVTDSVISKKRVETAFGRVAYLEAGPPDAPAVLLVHGIPTSSYLWRHVMRVLQAGYRCLAPDLLGLGDSEPRADLDLHMETQAEMLLDFASALGVERFALVAHDQGGAAAQIIAARLPERLLALVLTNVVCYDNWPVPAVARLQALARLPLLGDLIGPSGLAEWIEKRTPLSSLRRGVFDSERMSDEAIAEYLRPLRGNKSQREAFRRFLLAGHPRYTQLAASALRRFDRPTLVLWGADDVYLSPSWGRKLYEEIPGACGFELIPFCGHFWQEERPAEPASHIRQFLDEHLGASVSATVTAALDDTGQPALALGAGDGGVTAAEGV